MNFIRYAAVACLISLASPVTFSNPAFESADPDLRACAERDSATRTLSQLQHVRVSSDAGWMRESRRRVRMKRDDDSTLSVLFEVEAPQTEAGMKVLIIKKATDEPVAWVYLPELGRGRRVVGSGAGNSVLGTDFSYEDMLYFERFLQAQFVNKTEIEHAGRAAWLLETSPSAESSAYGRIELILDQQTCLPLGAEFWKRNGERAKSMIVDPAAIRTIEGHNVLEFVTMRDHQRGSQTDIRIDEIVFNPVLRAGMFSPSEIKNGR